MSTIKVNKIENTGTTNGGVEIDSSGHVTVDDQQIPTAGALSNRNLVQNGAMTVSQRSTSKSSLTSGNNYILDRWRTYIQNIGTYTISQASDAPAGFKYSYKIQCTTADASPAAADDMSFYCPFEGQDLQQLKKGTSSAESLTLSFWIKSNKTATGQVNIRDQDNNRLISGTYTVSASGTWEYKTITFPGDTTGALDNDNAASISIQWYLDSGSNFSSGSMNTTWGADSTNKRNVNNFGLASSTNNYWQITGIQLEVGSKATSFEHRSFGDELSRCQRYFHKSGEIGTAGEWFPGVQTHAEHGHVMAMGMDGLNDRAIIIDSFPTTMRAPGSAVFYPGRDGVTNDADNITIYNSDAKVTTTAKPTPTTRGFEAYFVGTSSDSRVYTLQYTVDSEL